MREDATALGFDRGIDPACALGSTRILLQPLGLEPMVEPAHLRRRCLGLGLAGGKGLSHEDRDHLRLAALLGRSKVGHLAHDLRVKVGHAALLFVGHRRPLAKCCNLLLTPLPQAVTVCNMRERQEPDFISPPHEPIAPAKKPSKLVEAISALERGMAITVSPYRWDLINIANGFGKTCSPPRRYRTRKLAGRQQQIERIE